MSGRAITKIPVLFFYDEESQNWGFHIENPRIVGGGQRTLEKAREAAIEAIAFAIEEPPEDTDGRIEFIPITIGARP
ncbi:MAG: hypothetical protein GEU73_06170 [Chloroflexi bacterium]|nr:hypothetical protein [Chloroflexota bacterium]